VGWAGVLLNNRSFLAVYTFMLWLCFAMLVTPGYVTYRRRTFNLEGKINSQWSRQLGADGRLRIQTSSSAVDTSVLCRSDSQSDMLRQECLARVQGALPLVREASLDEMVYRSVRIGTLHIAIMLAGLLCSNHVTYRFGKGMMPKAYRLSMNSMAVIMDNYAKCVSFPYIFSYNILMVAA